MSIFYLDTSAIVKRYFPEVGSLWIRALTDLSAGNTLILSVITRVEAAAAFAIKYRSGATSIEERDVAFKLLVLHTTTEYQIAPLDAGIIDQAMNSTQHHRLRGYDAVQLATALVINAQYLVAGLPHITFLSADNDLLVAADAEGLATDNPNNHV